MASHQQDLYEQDGFSEKKRKCYKVITRCVMCLGGVLGLIYGGMILDVVKPAGEALEDHPGLADGQILRQDAMEVKQTKIHLCEVNKALLLYQLKYATRGLPSSLKVLVEEGLLEQEELLDYWKQPFVYTPNIGDRPMDYELKSIGIDGQCDTRDDIVLRMQ
jgi:hypothetical protein